MKDINTLIDDIHHVLKTGEGWDENLAAEFGRASELLLLSRMGTKSQGDYLRLSNVGTPCDRKLWYTCNESDRAEDKSPTTLLKFLYGDLTELLVLYLAKAAGHSVEGEQSSLSVGGVKGHRDCIIDGFTIDVKSTAPFGFSKFKEHTLEQDDPFGYLGQLKSYLVGGRDDPRVLYRNHAGFLVFDKTLGHMCLDMWEWTDEELEDHVEMVHEKVFMVEEKEAPPRGYAPEPDGYKHKEKGFVPNGNEYLGTFCSYCDFKFHCYDNKLRTFMYKDKPKFFTKIVKEPNVPEVIADGEDEKLI